MSSGSSLFGISLMRILLVRFRGFDILSFRSVENTENTKVKSIAEGPISEEIVGTIATEINSYITSGCQKLTMGTTLESAWSLPNVLMVEMELCSLHSQAAAHILSW